MSAPLRLDRALIRVSGPDARPFLQNLLTQDVDGLDAAPAIYAGLLSPQGKVVADMLLWRGDSGDIVLELSRAHGASVLHRLSLYKLRANVALEDVSAKHAALFAPTAFAGACPDPRLPDGSLGWRALAAAQPALGDGEAAYQRQRLAAGVPDLALDAADEEVFALEALFEELNGVDFQKGCFVGQENVSRMKRRATTRKKFCPIAFDGPPLAFGTPVQAGEIALGTVRSGAPGRALALLRLDRALEAGPLVCDGRPVRLDPPPWLILPRAEETR